ncbi:DUF2599 domain-containing protein [Sinomonas sp. P47F7]|uniref:DUF2599 domain-containing protein n=1 Tax=Sinomonas sp. P47F7 TaxID=3410987 RepID=UPI003BF48078
MKKTALAIISILAGVQFLHAAPASASPPDWANGVASAVEKVAPPIYPASRGKSANGLVQPKSQPKKASVRVQDRATVIDAATNPVTKSVLSITVVNAAERRGQAANGSVVIGSSNPAVSFAVQSYEHGTRISSVTSDPSGSLQTYELADGFAFTPTPEGGALVVDKAGTAVGQLASPWARDATGRDLPTSYTFEGSRMTQSVDTSDRNTQFPVVADPYFGIDLIDHAYWKFEVDGWVFKVFPAWWARSNAYSSHSYLVGAFGWDELYSKYASAGLNTNLNGMRDQYICHQVVVGVRDPNKESWNLDEWRPDVGWWETVNSYCNPGGNRLFD